jgi:hypothetical protein
MVECIAFKAIKIKYNIITVAISLVKNAIIATSLAKKRFPKTIRNQLISVNRSEN